MKKFVCTVMILALMTSFAACGSFGTGDETAKEAEETTIAESEVEEDDEIIDEPEETEATQLSIVDDHSRPARHPDDEDDYAFDDDRRRDAGDAFETEHAIEDGVTDDEHYDMYEGDYYEGIEDDQESFRWSRDSAEE